MDANILITAVVTTLGTFIASSGFWAYIQNKDSKRSATTQIIAGLAYDKITWLGMGFIERGWMTRDEYDDFRKFLYDPYRKLGGNGMAERVMEDVQRLPIRSHATYLDIIKTRIEEKESGDGRNDPDAGSYYEPRI